MLGNEGLFKTVQRSFLPDESLYFIVGTQGKLYLHAVLILQN